MATVAAPAPRPRPVRARSVQARHVIFGLLGLLMIVVWFTRDYMLLIPNSFLRQRYSPIAWIVMLHGIPGAAALFLGVLQFSARLRQRHLQWHRVMGRIYVVSVFIAAPVSLVLSVKLPLPSGTYASAIQAFGWMVTTATALYCVKTGQIQQHREWMIRSYPFAMVFVVVRAVTAIPAVAAVGVMGLVATVWSCIAVACFLPSFLIEWQKLATNRRSARPRAAARA
jgi:uncharacterized membrane protein